jgi:stalled ribosome rescue protein Dom34
MAYDVVWIDRQNAQIYHLGQTGEDFEAHGSAGDHRTRGKDTEPHESEKFYHEVASHLSDSSFVLIVGPGVGRQRFESHLRQHDPRVAKVIKGNESADHSTPHHLKALVRRFFADPLHA